MKLHNFFVDEPIGDSSQVVVKDPTLINQWRRVLRLHEGAVIALFDNSGYVFTATIVSLKETEAALTVAAKEKNKNIPRRELWLYASLIKKDKFEWVLEKGTELGVTHFVPVLAERSEKKSLDEVRSKKIIREAAEQSAHATLPVLHEIVKTESLTSPVPLVALHLEGEKIDDARTRGRDSVGLLVGPEGGWSEQEVSIFKGRHIPICSMGGTTLRAETASLAAATLFLL